MEINEQIKKRIGVSYNINFRWSQILVNNFTSRDFKCWKSNYCKSDIRGIIFTKDESSLWKDKYRF